MMGLICNLLLGFLETKTQEIWVGENRLYLDENNIISITIIGDVDEEKAIGFQQNGLKLANLVEEKVNILIDLNKAGKQSAEARKIGKETFEHGKNNKIAIFGIHPVAKGIASFVMGVTKKKDMRFFKNKEDALAWLKEEV